MSFPLWSGAGMRAVTRPWLITGGAGYIGAHVVRELTGRGIPVVVYDDLSTGLRCRVTEVPLVQGSVLDEPLLTATLRTHRVAGVMHLAARKQVSESMTTPLRYYRDNIDGLRAVLSSMQQAGVEEIVYTSSAAVYGEHTGRVTEGSACLPANPYGVSKLVGEWMLRDQAWACGLRYVVLRYFNVAGASDPVLADRNRTNLVPLALLAVAAGERPTVFGTDYDTPDGTCVRDYVHVADVASAHVAAIDLLGTECAETFNVGVGRGHSVREVLAAVGDVTGLRVDPLPVARRPGDPSWVVADVGRIRHRLGWAAAHDLHSMVASAWQALRNNDSGPVAPASPMAGNTIAVPLDAGDGIHTEPTHVEGDGHVTPRT